jgi:hypothetical protein
MGGPEVGYGVERPGRGWEHKCTEGGGGRRQLNSTLHYAAHTTTATRATAATTRA